MQLHLKTVISKPRFSVFPTTCLWLMLAYSNVTVQSISTLFPASRATSNHYKILKNATNCKTRNYYSEVCDFGIFLCNRSKLETVEL